mmetsp:Transcript_25853/g.41454  ORF Transcript_25853/g.41454 Transcript_25853/m.41454 type:complete len:122 (+) Transcript_25853:1682-2047(+)
MLHNRSAICANCIAEWERKLVPAGSRSEFCETSSFNLPCLPCPFPGTFSLLKKKSVHHKSDYEDNNFGLNTQECQSCLVHEGCKKSSAALHRELMFGDLLQSIDGKRRFGQKTCSRNYKRL